MIGTKNLLPGLVLLAVAGCSQNLPTVPGDGTTDSDTDSDSDGDTDTDSDSDGDVDTDDTGPGEYCPEGTPDLFNNAHSPYYGGEEDVWLEVVNITYFRCPHCAYFSKLADQIWNDRDDFTAHVRFYYHHFPFSNESAWELHAATVAAGQQGMENFWALHDYLYAGINDNDPSVYYSIEEVLAFCDNVLNLDMEQLEEDRLDEQTQAFLEWDKGQALAQGVGGTPTVFVCGEKRNYNNIEAVVDGFLYPSGKEGGGPK